MILNPGALLIHQLWNRVPSERDGRHTVEKFRAFISKFNSINSVSLLLILILVVEESGELCLYQISEIRLWIKQTWPILQGIQEENDFVVVRY